MYIKLRAASKLALKLYLFINKLQQLTESATMQTLDGRSCDQIVSILVVPANDGEGSW